MPQPAERLGEDECLSPYAGPILKLVCCGDSTRVQGNDEREMCILQRG